MNSLVDTTGASDISAIVDTQLSQETKDILLKKNDHIQGQTIVEQDGKKVSMTVASMPFMKAYTSEPMTPEIEAFGQKIESLVTQANADIQSIVGSVGGTNDSSMGAMVKFDRGNGNWNLVAMLLVDRSKAQQLKEIMNSL